MEIRGQGFSSVASDNAVSFSGAVADVLEASPTKLRAVVPAAATTGPITVAAGGRSASSVQAFVVDENTRAPVIDSIAPLAVAAGEAVVVDGRRFLPVAGQTALRLNGRPVPTDALTDIRATVRIPAGASSGKLSITTPYGIGVGAQTVLVVPPSISAGSVAQVQDMAMDGPATGFAVASSQQHAAALFQGAAGDYITAQFSAMSAGLRLRYTLYNLSNQVLASGTVNAEYPSLHLPRLSSSGMYLLLLQPASASANWSLALERAKPLVADGALVAVDTAVAGQQRRLTFDPGGRSDFGLGIADRSTPASWGSASLYVYKPDGAQVGYQFCDQAKLGCSMNLSGLGAGVHTLVISPAATGARLLGFDAVLSVDRRVPLVRDQAAQLNLDRRGVNERRTFDGLAGEVLALQVAGQVTVPAGREVYYRVIGPNGATIASVATKLGVTLNLVLPASGSYEVLIDTENGETLTAQMTLSSGASGVQVGGNETVFETFLAGQGVFATFPAAAGQNLGLGLSELTLAAGLHVDLVAYAPDGGIAASTVCYAANDGCDLNLSNTQAGVYAFAVRPAVAGQTMRFKATLSEDVVAALASGSTTALSIGRRGQNGRLGFSGVAGQVIRLDVSAQQTVPADQTVYYRLQKAGGGVLAAMGVLSGQSLTAELPMDGDYVLFADPGFGASVQAQVALSPGVFGPMVLDGDTGRYETTAAGQSVTLNIDATAGQFLGVGITDVIASTGTSVRARWYAPGGSQVESVLCSVGTGNGCDFDMAVTLSGRHQIVVSPEFSGQTFKFKATLSRDLTSNLSADVPRVIAIERPGQNARLSFSASAGQHFAVLVSGQANVPAERDVTYTVIAPGNRRTSQVTRTGTGLHVPVTATGTYVLAIDPSNASMPNARITLSSGVPLEANGSSAHFQSVAPGDWAFVSVDASRSGMGVGIRDLSTSDNGNVKVDVYPWDQWAVTSTCATSFQGCDLDLAKQNNRYGVLVRPDSYARVMDFTLTSSSDLQAALRRDEPVEMILPRKGQNAVYTFVGKAGERLGLSVSGQVLAPDMGTVAYTVRRPDGGLHQVPNTDAFRTGFLHNLHLPADGTYQLFVDPTAGNSAQARIALSTGTASGLAPDGPAVRFETTLPGQGVYLTTSSAAAALRLSLRNMELSSGSEVKVIAYRPTSTTLYDTYSCKLVNGGCDVGLAMSASGTWAVAVLPTNAEQAMRFDATLATVP